MQTSILNILSSPLPEPAPETVLSFRPYIEFLKSRRKESNHYQNRIFGYVIEQFEQHPELLSGIQPEEADKYSDQLMLIYSTLNPAITDEHQHLWALSMPIRPVLFYSTDAMYGIVEKMLRKQEANNLVPFNETELNRDKLMYCYSFILERCYGIPNFFTKDLVRGITDSQSGLIKYYRQKLDTRFIEIYPKKPLPELDMAALQSPSQDNKYLLPQLQELLPLDMFRMEGFTISSIEDVTPQYAIENIKTLLLEHKSVQDEDFYHRYVSSLKSLIGSNEIEFGLLPFLKVNDQLIFMEKPCDNSVIVRSSKQYGIESRVYQALANEYTRDPRPFFLREINPEVAGKKEIFHSLYNAGIQSYAMLPVYFNNVLLGALEVYSMIPGKLTDALLARLEPAMSLMSQMLKNTIDDFQGNIEKVIKEKFTAVQPSVQWKFNEVAWHYLQQSEKDKERKLEEIGFNDVFPLYGAIDIRNSTVQRNAALRMDLMVQFDILLTVLQELKTVSGFGLLDEKIFIARQWLEKIGSTSDGFNEQIALNDYLEFDVLQFLEDFSRGNPALKDITGKYFEAINEKTGVAHRHRRQLEVSMTTLIGAVNNYLDMLKDEIQSAYPSYFEKFRTDGVEYDIYIGQSITPGRPYSNIYLKNLRLLQLSSMAAIAKYTHSLKVHLEKPIETTQLIFIHSHPIDIKFRTDEKRFDVEGAYNIRYHIIKKRIDKVRIKDTQERLTQPNKIALVYFNQKEADEYVNYIRYLSEEGLLNAGIEYLELEEMQGVAGLKALRVEVAI